MGRPLIFPHRKTFILCGKLQGKDIGFLFSSLFFNVFNVSRSHYLPLSIPLYFCPSDISLSFSPSIFHYSSRFIIFACFSQPQLTEGKVMLEKKGQRRAKISLYVLGVPSALVSLPTSSLYFTLLIVDPPIKWSRMTGGLFICLLIFWSAYFPLSFLPYTLSGLFLKGPTTGTQAHRHRPRFFLLLLLKYAYRSFPP